MDILHFSKWYVYPYSYLLASRLAQLLSQVYNDDQPFFTFFTGLRTGDEEQMTYQAQQSDNTFSLVTLYHHIYDWTFADFTLVTDLSIFSHSFSGVVPLWISALLSNKIFIIHFLTCFVCDCNLSAKTCGSFILISNFFKLSKFLARLCVIS